MISRRWLLTLVFAALGAGAIACAADEDLNPQPLPPKTEPDLPKGGESSGSTSVPAASSGGGSSSGTGSSSSSSGTDFDTDAGDAGDAGDGGDAGS